METKYRLLAALCFTVIAVDLLFLIGWSVDAEYEGSTITGFGDVHFVDDVEEVCGEGSGACIFVGHGLVILPSETPPIRQYLKCGHEKQHHLHPNATHGEGIIENYVDFENTFGWHPECAEIALNYH